MNFVLEMYRITCPKCGGESYIKDYEPGPCPHCGKNLSEVGFYNLKPKTYTPQVIVSQMTGDIGIIPHVEPETDLFQFATQMTKENAKLISG